MEQHLRADDAHHDSLNYEQLQKVKRIHNAFSEVTKNTLAETINNFSEYQDPDHEILIWSNMAIAYERFAVNKHIEEYDKKQEAFELLLLRSKVSEKEALAKYGFKYLSNDEAREILSYYAAQ